MDRISLKNKIRSEKLKFDIQIAEIAEYLNCNRSVIYYMDNKGEQNIYFRYIKQLRTFGVDLNILFADISDFRARLKEAKLKHNITTKDIAGKSNIEQGNISYVERNAGANIRIKYLKFLLDRGIDLNYLFDNECKT